MVLLTWWLYSFGGRDVFKCGAVWTFKPPQLVAVNYTGSIVIISYRDPIATEYTEIPLTTEHIDPIAVL